MSTVEIIRYSLDNAFDILGQVTADLTPALADWTPPGIANPIGATYWHAVSGADEVIFGWGMGQAPLHKTGGWRERVLTVAPPEPGRGGDYLAYMRAIRVDLSALHDYTRAVVEGIRGWLDTLTPADLEREVDTPIGKLNLAQLLATFVIWHINAHCGEIAALKGCQGARGYPF